MNYTIDGGRPWVFSSTSYMIYTRNDLLVVLYSERTLEVEDWWYVSCKRQSSDCEVVWFVQCVWVHPFIVLNGHKT